MTQLATGDFPVPDPNTHTPYHAALDAIHHGWIPIPIYGLTITGTCMCPDPDCLTRGSAGKHPYGKEWEKRQTPTPQEFHNLWGRHGYNAGVLTGLPSLIIILDIDPRNGGNESLADAEFEHGDLPVTRTVATARHGRHYYFTYPPGLDIRTMKLAPGIDLLSTGAQAVLPGSQSSAGTYKLLDDSDLAPLPQWVIDLAATITHPANLNITMAADLPHYQTLPDPTRRRYDAYAKSVITAEVAAYVRESWGNGSKRLYNACCSILEIVQSPWNTIGSHDAYQGLESARSARIEAARTTGRPHSGQTPKELLATWNSALSTVRGKGRPTPIDIDPAEGCYMDTSSILPPARATEPPINQDAPSPQALADFERKQRRALAIQHEVERIEIREQAQQIVKEKKAQELQSFPAIIGGKEFVTYLQNQTQPLWGNDESCLWQRGESLMIVGPPGVGKTTIAHLILWARLGICDTVLDFDVEPDDRNILYLAMDRPAQIARAMARIAKPKHYDLLEEKLKVHRGPLPVAITTHPEWLLEQCMENNIGTVFVDSIKDAVPEASKEEYANRYNQVRQLHLSNTIQWVELHHNRKAGAENKEITTLDDVYGSRWITAGAGSVINLHGHAGDSIIEMSQIKIPAGEFFPQNVTFNKDHGTAAFYHQISIEDVIKASGYEGCTARQIASRVFKTDHPTNNNNNIIRNKINRLMNKGEPIEKVEAPFANSGQGEGSRYRWLAS